MALQALSQGPPVALGPGSRGGAGGCAEERGVAGSTPSGGSGALAGLVRRQLAWLTGRPHSGGVKQWAEAYGWNSIFHPTFQSFQNKYFSLFVKLKTGFTTWLARLDGGAMAVRLSNIPHQLNWFHWKVRFKCSLKFLILGSNQISKMVFFEL